MRTDNPRRLRPLAATLTLLGAAMATLLAGRATGHFVPPEKLHPVTESYRRMTFVLGLNPVAWGLVESDARVIAESLNAVNPEDGARYRDEVAAALAAARQASAGGGLDPVRRRESAALVFERSTRAVARSIIGYLRLAEGSLGDHASSTGDLEAARGIWAAFEHEIRHADPVAFRTLGASWLELSGALGSPGVLGAGRTDPDAATFRREAAELGAYLTASFVDFEVAAAGALAPLPLNSPTFDRSARIPARLPPGHDINKQLPRPRQILHMAARGVDESETVLIALGDMAFDSPYVFGEPARSLGMSCNTCHNKGVTNPGFFVPGISTREGGLDVSNSFFAPHANNGHFDPIDIPDLRGIRFTAPYGRNGRFASLRDFVRNVIVNEFNGPEPDPMVLDGLIAYMLEFDFLPNPYLEPDGRLSAKAPDAARRGERLFHQPFEQMGGRACATCHVPSDHFVDHRTHDIGTAAPAAAGALDGAKETPTLLNSRYTAPYFHDGRAPTLRAVVEWFDTRFALGLTRTQMDDLTAYLETVGAGEGPYEETIFTLDAELEEFSFFLSTYEFLSARGRDDLNRLTFQTIATEIRAHKWDVQDDAHMPVLDRLAELMDEAETASRRGDRARVDALVGEYRTLYARNAEVLQ